MKRGNTYNKTNALYVTTHIAPYKTELHVGPLQSSDRHAIKCSNHLNDTKSDKYLYILLV